MLITFKNNNKIPDKLGASTTGNPPPENQQFTQVSQQENNGQNTPSSYFSNFSIDTAVLWALLLKTPFFL